MPGQRAWWSRSLAVFAGIALLAAACADDSSDSGGSSDAPGPTGTPIRIATVTSIEAENLGLPHVAEGAQAAVDAINADGGIDGRPLELDVCDDHNTANDASACGRSIAGDQDVLAVVGTSTVFADDLLPLLEGSDVPAVGVFPAGVAAYTSTISFPISGGAFALFQGVAAAALDGGYERPAIVYLDAAEVEALLGGMRSALEEGGAPLVAEVPVSPTATDLTPAITRALDSDPDAVIVALAETQYDLALQGVFQLGGDDVAAIAPVADPEILENLGEAASITSFVSTFPPPSATDVPAIKQMNDDFDEFAPDVQRDLASTNAWASVQLFASVAHDLAAQGTPIDRTNVLAALNALDDYQSGGLTPVLNFTKPGSLPRLFNDAVTFVRFEDGELVGSGTFVSAETGQEVPPSS